VKPSYAAGMLRLTLLRPALIEAILDGSQPTRVTLVGLMAGVPAMWAEQSEGLLPGMA
jgi:hypothetical protein